jgi:hypothetical protein
MLAGKSNMRKSREMEDRSAIGANHSTAVAPLLAQETATVNRNRRRGGLFLQGDQILATDDFGGSPQNSSKALINSEEMSAGPFPSICQRSIM